MAALSWNAAKINGEQVYFADTNDQRLYVKQRPSSVEGWVGSIKVGNFATIEQAKSACARRVGLNPAQIATPKPQPKPTPKPQPKRKPQPEARFHEPRLAKGARFGDPKKRRPAEETKLAAYPITDLREPGAPVVKVLPEPMRPVLSLFKKGPPCSKCGAVLGRSGKCPALCAPPHNPLPKYNGPTMIGKQIGPAPVPVGDDWIG